jgi:hypothetical protein
MHGSSNQRWAGVALLAGVTYFVVGRVFALPANHVQAWRLAAWMVSGVVFAAHIGYEHFTLRNSPRLGAWHTSTAVAIGAMALAIAGMVHSLSVAPTIRPAWLLALVLWPAITGIPAFLAALVAGTVLTRLSRRPSVR